MEATFQRQKTFICIYAMIRTTVEGDLLVCALNMGNDRVMFHFTDPFVHFT